MKKAYSSSLRLLILGTIFVKFALLNLIFMNKYFLLLIILFTVFYTKIGASQNLLITNSITSEPIPGTIVSDTLKTIYKVSNSRGIVDLAELTQFTHLVIHHNYYQNITLSLDSIKSLNYKIKLEELTIHIGGLTIMANKWEQETTEIPFTISTVTPKEVRFINPQITADMLAQTGNIFIQKSQSGGGSPMIRGFSANSVLLVVDGVRMNNAIFRSGNLQNSLNIDPNALGHIEVIYGPGSVTYGSDALGGVMDFHTKEAEFSFSDKLEANVEGFYRTSSANLERSTSIGVDLKWKSFGSHTQISYSNFANLRVGKNHFGNYPEFGKRNFVVSQTESKKDTMVAVDDPNIMFPSLFTTQSINQKFRYKPNNKLDITYSFIYSNTSDIPRYDRLTLESGDYLKYAQWYYGPQTWLMHNLRFRLFKPTKIYDSGKIIMAYQNFKESRNDRKFGSTALNQRQEEVDFITLNIDFSKNLAKHTTLYYGLDAGFNNVTSTAHMTDIVTEAVSPIQTRYPNLLNHYTSSGLFFNLKHKLSKSLSLMAGFRYSFVSLNSQFDTTLNQLPFQDLQFFNYAPNGSFGMAWMAKDDLQLNMNLATGFRAPNLDDAAKIFDSEPGSVVVPNPDLKPEYVYSGEISLIKTFGKIAKFEMTVYASYINNLIVRKDFIYEGMDSIFYDGTLSQVQAMQNADYAKLFGGNLNLSINFSKKLSLSSAYNLAKGMDSDNNNLRHIPPHFGNTRLTYKNHIFTASIFADYSQRIAFDQLAPTEQEKTNLYTPDGAEAWYTLNFISDIKLYQRIHLNFGVTNILDRFYMPYSSGIPAPGRSFMIGIRLMP